ncbi:MAG: hypothetical protein CVU39_07820 [Chloroflexi bacterium HGW-Chloroflexi-10]|nr:MAG: hypothetical protein CVU39_07820 [Chloroflexi bacterium HGW-Chloroflexi-10]
MKKHIPWLAILIFLLAITARLLPGARTIDDSFITFRYARNLLSSAGFAYNPGEAVMGTTTPLYTLLMAALGAATGGVDAAFPQLALGVNALADGITALLLWHIGKRHFNQPLAGLSAALVWAVAPHSVTFAIGGLETSIYVLLLTGCVTFYLERKVTPAAFLAGLSMLTRPDALILIGPLALDHLVRVIRKQEPLTLRQILALGLLPLVWYGYATWQFGSPIPHSVQAKMGAYILEPTAALVRLLQHYTTPFMQHTWFGAAIGVGLGLVLYPFLFFVGALAAFRANPRSLPWIAYPWLYFLVFAVANPLIFRWYLTPPMPAYFLLVLTGAAVFLQQLLPRLRLPQHSAQGVLAVFVVLMPVATSLSAWSLRPDHGPQRPAPEMAWFKLELLYRQAAEIVSPYLDTTTTLAAGDVGVLGFYTPGLILDTVGLNSPVALEYYPLDQQYYVINYAISPDLIIDQQPDALIMLEVYGRLGLLQDPRFLDQYSLLQKIPTDIYESDGMLVFLRNTNLD